MIEKDLLLLKNKIKLDKTNTHEVSSKNKVTLEFLLYNLYSKDNIEKDHIWKIEVKLNRKEKLLEIWRLYFKNLMPFLKEKYPKKSYYFYSNIVYEILLLSCQEHIFLIENKEPFIFKTSMKILEEFLNKLILENKKD